MTPPDDLDGVRAHLERFFSDSPHVEIASRHERTEAAVPGLRVREIAPARAGVPWVYATVGASQVLEDDEPGIEFFVLAPVRDAVLPEMLAALATAHADPSTRLRVGSTLRLGRPWIADSPADRLLVSLPYPFGPAFENCDLGHRRVQMLWLVPITESEARLVERDGHRALEQRFERERVNVTAAHRPSVV